VNAVGWTGVHAKRVFDAGAGDNVCHVASPY
jgi:hypothetical protein